VKRSIQGVEPVTTAEHASAARVSVLPQGCAATGARRRLLAASIQLFAARGYYGVSVRDIANAMGVKTSSLYAQFPSKDALFGHLVLMANETIREELRASVLDAGADPVDQLRAVVECYVAFHVTYPLLATVGHNELHVLSGDTLHSVAASRREAVDLVRAVIERGNSHGRFSCEEPTLAIAAIVAMGIRLATWYRAPEAASDDPAAAYPLEVRSGMPLYDTSTVTRTFTTYALAIVGHPG
jgi:AcrR family transcriptional regulator